jgi:hypothetical protein
VFAIVEVECVSTRVVPSVLKVLLASVSLMEEAEDVHFQGVTKEPETNFFAQRMVVENDADLTAVRNLLLVVLGCVLLMEVVADAVWMVVTSRLNRQPNSVSNMAEERNVAMVIVRR